MDGNTDETPNQNSLSNLQPPWQPGKSANPKGRPKGAFSFTTLLKKLLKEKVTLTDDQGNVIATVTKKRAILLKWLEKAMNGDTKAIDKIVTRIDGKPVQPVKHSGSIDSSEKTKQIADDLHKLVKQYGDNPEQ